MNRFQCVADHQRRYGVKRLCSILGVSRSSFYYWRRTAAGRAARQAGSRREAHRPDTGRAQGIGRHLRSPENHRRAPRDERRGGQPQAGRQTHAGVRNPRGPPAPSAPHHRPRPGRGQGTGPDRPRLHRRKPEHEVRRRHHLPAHRRGKFCYLATVIDLASRRLAGWAIADHMRADLVTDALAAAIRTRGSLAGSIMHTDHGAQYTSRAFAEACRSAGVRRSMSAVGSSADNALAESFNATFKRETLQGRKSWPDECEARLDAFRWLHRYNTRRRHSRLGQRSPIAFENALHLTPTTLAPAA